MSERMTDERLEEIRAIIARQQAYLLQQGWSEKGFVGSPASELLAEVDRLRAEIAEYEAAEKAAPQGYTS